MAYISIIKKYIYFTTLILLIYFYKITGRVLLFIFNNKKKPYTIAYLCAFNEENAGFNWRVKKWAEILDKNKYEVKLFMSMDKCDFIKLQNPNPSNELILLLIKNLNKRFWQIIKCRNIETVIVRREILIYNDYDNLFLEKLLLKMNPNTVLDFDDSIGVSKENNKTSNKFIKKLFLNNTNKFHESLNIYNNFIVATDYLKSYVELRTKDIKNILVLPTCVDYNKFIRKKYNPNISSLNIGWIGSNNNIKELNEIVDILNKLSKLYNFKLTIISGKSLDLETDFEVDFINWSLENEVESLLKIDIGIMPLRYNDVTKGKGGFKLIQYMGLGIVSIASPITVNKEIVNHRIDSFLAKGKSDWEKILIEVFKKNVNLDKIGRNAFLKINNNYSFDSNQDNFLKFIKTLQNENKMG